ncbi:hypothetical protein QTP88_005886 [Uroleucon formosanum]
MHKHHCVHYTHTHVVHIYHYIHSTLYGTATGRFIPVFAAACAAVRLIFPVTGYCNYYCQYRFDFRLCNCDSGGDGGGLEDKSAKRCAADESTRCVELITLIANGILIKWDASIVCGNVVKSSTRCW